MAKPEIRLKGFEGEWNHSCFKDLYYSNSIKNNLLFDTDKIISVANMYFNPGNTISDKNYLRTYNIFKLGDIAFEGNRSKNYAHGRFVENTIGDGIVSHVFKVFSPKSDKFDLKYWKYAINNERVMGKILVRCTKASTMMNDLVEKDFLREFVNHPSFNEQIEIGNFMESLDSMIQGVTKKIASLKQMKQACLVSMFPQTGETTPRVRFKGFKGEWNKDKAGNLFMTFNERNRPDLPVLSANQDIRGMAPRTDTGYNISHNKANEITYKVVKPGQYVIHLRSFQGGFAHSDVEGITSPAYTVFGFKDGSRHDDYFWKIIFMSKEFIKSLETITYGIRDGRSISFIEFAEMSFLFPSKDEQHQIASFFCSLDSQISLQEQRLEKLKQIKSVCLDKMFV